MSKLKHALTLAAAGHRVFPLVQNGKTPAHATNWRITASSDPARVAEMWTDPVFESELDYNIGIALDKNTLVVDVDVRNGKQGAKSLALLEAIHDDFPPTVVTITPSGGLHCYFHTEDSSGFPAKLATDIDLKGEGGYVVGPGSTIDGNDYRSTYGRGRGDGEPDAPTGHGDVGLLTKTVPARLPKFIHELRSAAPRIRSVEPTTPLVDLDRAPAIERAIDWLTAAPESGTYKVACRVKDFGISREKCLDLMLEYWPPAEAKGYDHVSFRVDNAYRHGQNAPGIASAEAEFEPVEIDQKQRPKRKGLHYITWKDAKPDFEQPYLIDGVLDLATMAVTYGDSNTGKTYVKLDQAFHIAAGLDWNGHKVKQGGVVYVAAEGGRGFSRRVAAFKVKYKVEELPFAIVPCAVDLFSENGDTAKMVKLIRQVEADFGQKCVLIVVDTLARAMAGGDENTSADMGKFVRNCDRLREAIGATVNIIHHTGKDKAKGARGSSALRAATDTEIEIDVGKLAVTKQRDMAKGEEMHFELESVEIGHRSDGKVVTACVVQWVAESEFDSRVSPAAMEMLGVLEQLIAAEQDRIEEETGTDETNKSDIKIDWQMWQMSLLSCMKGARGKSINRTALFVLRRELYENGLVKKDKNNQWFMP